VSLTRKIKNITKKMAQPQNMLLTDKKTEKHSKISYSVAEKKTEWRKSSATTGYKIITGNTRCTNNKRKTRSNKRNQDSNNKGCTATLPNRMPMLQKRSDNP
jgi:hypothetical protein